MMRGRGILAAALLAVAALWAPSPAAARPNYFATFTGIYGFTPGQDLYSCGVCHRRWEGTGARNPFGTAVEQQLYIGKTITQAILDVESADTDGDGFSNVDELTIHGTLPGYNCSNYALVIHEPPNFQSLITPFVPSCLEPFDVLVTPLLASFLAQVNTVKTVVVEIANNGTDEPIHVSNYELLAGSHASFSVSGPALPIVIPVGESAFLDVDFAPTTTSLAGGTLRVSSDDPDEPTIDVTLTGIGFVKSVAPSADRALCFGEARKRVETYTRTHLNEWTRCYTDELRGLGCDAGRRDNKIAVAAAKLRSYIGGAKDKKCAGKAMTPTRLDLPATCGAPCQSIQIVDLNDWTDCMVCQQETATFGMLQASTGASPPDLPGNVLGTRPHRCNKNLVKTAVKAIRKIQRKLGLCRLANVGAPLPVDCEATLAADIAVETARVNAVLGRCADTTGLLGCLFAPMPNAQCVGDASSAAASTLVDSVFDTAE